MKLGSQLHVTLALFNNLKIAACLLWHNAHYLEISLHTFTVRGPIVLASLTRGSKNPVNRIL